MAKKAKSRRPGLLRTLLAVLVVLALAATLLFTVFRRQVDTMEYPCRYNEYVEYYAGKYNIDPLILYSFIRTESNFNPNAQSNVGARGLMQITEETFDWIDQYPSSSPQKDGQQQPRTAAQARPQRYCTGRAVSLAVGFPAAEVRHAAQFGTGSSAVAVPQGGQAGV